MGTDVRRRGRQVNWTIPGELYSAIRKHHDWALSQNLTLFGDKVPKSEEDFCLALLLRGYLSSEEAQRKWEKATDRIVTPPTNIIL